MSGKTFQIVMIVVLTLLLVAGGCGRSTGQEDRTKVEFIEKPKTTPEREKAVEPAKPTETKSEPQETREPEKTVETKTDSAKAQPEKIEPNEPVRQKTEPPKAVGTKPVPQRPIEGKSEPEKAIEPKLEPGKGGPGVKLALKFTADDVTTYKVTSEAQKSVEWQGPAPTKPTAFKGGTTSNRLEMTFAQRIKSVQENGNALAEVTIRALKYTETVRDNIVLDFDSSREKDKDNPLAKLVGQSYTIEINPSGRVLKVIGVNAALSAVAGGTTAHKRAQTLVSAEVIKRRHTIPALPATDKNQLKQGDNWSSFQTFNFGMMGTKSYERVYELKQVGDSPEGAVAVAEMKAVPSAEAAAEQLKNQPTGFISNLFDNKEQYTGRLTMDLKTGKVRSYTEKLKSEWVAVDPESAQKDTEPAALKMTAVRSFTIEMLR